MADTENNPAPEQVAVPATLNEYHALPIETRVALRKANPAAVEALNAAFWGARGMRTPSQGAAAPEATSPEATQALIPESTFTSYAAFLAAPIAVRTAYRAQHPGLVSTWEATFTRRTAAPAVRFG